MDKEEIPKIIHPQLKYLSIETITGSEKQVYNNNWVMKMHFLSFTDLCKSFHKHRDP